MTKKFSELRDQLSPESRARSDGLFRDMVGEMRLQDIRRAKALTQTELAALLAVNQAAISKLERRSDVYLSTLRDYIRAVGGELEIFAKFPDGSVKIVDFDEPSSPSSA